MIGHNNGPSMEAGQSWRKHAWGRARKALLPTLPIEVVRLRVKRAAELGLPYKTYAGIRASSGDDVIGFLFSTNALRLLRADDDLPEDRVRRLTRIRAAQRLALVHCPLSARAVAALAPIDGAAAAPTVRDTWSEVRESITRLARAGGGPASRYVFVGETAIEREWAEAGKTAGYLTGARFFGEEAAP